MTPFEAALAFLWPEEGGYSNRGNDHGGATNFGVTQREYDAYCARHKRSTQSVAGITENDATQVYQEDYWTPCRCDAMHDKVAIALFDWAVNHGPSGAIKTLQQCLGVAADGVIGQKTFIAINAIMEDVLLAKFLDARRAWYLNDITKNPNQSAFKDGWLKRVDDLSAYLQTLALSPME